MPVHTIKMTASQYRHLGQDPPGVRLELVDGEVVVSPSPTPKHSRVIFHLSRLLADFADRHDLGEVLLDVDTPLGPYDVRRPDILFFTKARLHLVAEDRLLGCPDLAVEVISPGSEKADREEKFQLYAQAGILYYWLVDPAACVLEAYTLAAGSYRLAARGSGADVISAEPFPALPIPLASVWGSA